MPNRFSIPLCGIGVEKKHGCVSLSGSKYFNFEKGAECLSVGAIMWVGHNAYCFRLVRLSWKHVLEGQTYRKGRCRNQA